MSPLVSVGIPSYNHAPFLPAAIESVLGQTVDDLHLVIADDGSTDGSLAIAERYAAAHPDRVTVLTHPGHANRGIGATANLYRTQMDGRFILGMGSDDVLRPDTLERAVDFLEARPDVGFVYGYAELIDEAGRRIPDARTFGEDMTRGGRTVERLVQGNKIPAMTVVSRRECLEQAGLENRDLVYSDWEMFVREAAHWEVGFIPCCLAGHRVHRSNVSLGASRATNVERALAVTEVLRERAPGVGGKLVEPRTLATIELQLGFLRFASSDETSAADALRRAFERDPALRADSRWLGDWLWARVLDRLLPDDGRCFASWVEGIAAPLLTPGAARAFRREAAATRREARAIELALAKRAPAAHRAALAAVALSPRRAADRRLAAVLLDSIGDGVPGNLLRRARRQLLGSP